MNKETLKAVKEAYKIESECISTMLEYLDEEKGEEALSQTISELKEIVSWCKIVSVILYEEGRSAHFPGGTQ